MKAIDALKKIYIAGGGQEDFDGIQGKKIANMHSVIYGDGLDETLPGDFEDVVDRVVDGGSVEPTNIKTGTLIIHSSVDTVTFYDIPVYMDDINAFVMTSCGVPAGETRTFKVPVSDFDQDRVEILCWMAHNSEFVAEGVGDTWVDIKATTDEYFFFVALSPTDVAEIRVKYA